MCCPFLFRPQQEVNPRRTSLLELAPSDRFSISCILASACPGNLFLASSNPHFELDNDVFACNRAVSLQFPTTVRLF